MALFVLTIKYSSTVQVHCTGFLNHTNPAYMHVQVMPYVSSELSFRCMQVRYLSLGVFAMFVLSRVAAYTALFP